MSSKPTIPPPPPRAAAYLPGPTAESLAKARELAKRDAEEHHVFFNDKGFHNHLVHATYAAASLGASPALLEEIYAVHAPQQRPRLPVDTPIKRENWKDHLGHEKHYSGQLEFFKSEIKERGEGQVVETYLFSEEANDAKGRMLARLVSGAVHPMILLGYGAEFSDSLVLAEGLASAAVHTPMVSPLLPPSLFSPSLRTSSASPSSLAAASLSATLSSLSLTSSTLTTFDVLAACLSDPSLAAGQVNKQTSESKLNDALRSSAERIREYAELWVVGEGEEQVAARLEELAWMALVVYAAGGGRAGKEFRADFFLMHCVTSSHFLPPLLRLLSPRSQRLLLTAHFRVTLAYWISRGRPPLALDVLMSSSVSPSPPTSPPKAQRHSGEKDEECVQPLKGEVNPWFGILQSALRQDDEHLLKTVRSLSQWAGVYGDAPRGRWAHTRLPGAGELDGTAWVRAAGLTMDAIGWVREGQRAGKWSHAGLGWDEVWEKREFDD